MMRSKVRIAGVLVSGILALTMLVSGAAAVDNMLADSDFDSEAIAQRDEYHIDGWSLGLGGDSAGELILDPNGIVGNCLFVRIDATGPDAWNPELHSPEFPLDLGETYTIDFWAKTEPGLTRDLGVKFEQLELWGGPSGPATVTDQWEHHYFTGVSDFQSPPNSVIHIAFELTEEDVWFDQFRVYQGEYVEAALAPVTPVGSLTTSWGKIKSR